MENILDRFLRYVAIDTQSDDSSESQPSTAKQFNLLSLLCKELQEMGVEANLDEYGYVMGRIPSNLEGVSSAGPLGRIPSATEGKDRVPTVGFIAHVDTAPDASGANVKPQIIN